MCDVFGCCLGDVFCNCCCYSNCFRNFSCFAPRRPHPRRPWPVPPGPVTRDKCAICATGLPATPALLCRGCSVPLPQLCWAAARPGQSTDVVGQPTSVVQTAVNHEWPVLPYWETDVPAPEPISQVSTTPRIGNDHSWILVAPVASLLLTGAMVSTAGGPRLGTVLFDDGCGREVLLAKSFVERHGLATVPLSTPPYAASF